MLSGKQIKIETEFEGLPIVRHEVVPMGKGPFIGEPQASGEETLDKNQRASVIHTQRMPQLKCRDAGIEHPVSVSDEALVQRPLDPVLHRNVQVQPF